MLELGDVSTNIRIKQSEAELMLQIMARRSDWSVIVALVGFSQEIHQEEAGLQEWGRAISRISPAWSVVAYGTWSGGRRGKWSPVA